MIRSEGAKIVGPPQKNSLDPLLVFSQPSHSHSDKNQKKTSLTILATESDLRLRELPRIVGHYQTTSCVH